MLFTIWYYLTMLLATLGAIFGFMLSAVYVNMNPKVVNQKMSNTVGIMHLILGLVVGLIGVPILAHVIPPVAIVFYIESFFRQNKIIKNKT